MSSSEDSYDSEPFDELQESPLLRKKNRLIGAVANNQVEVLRDLLDSPQWYHVTDQAGYNLLQLAIVFDNKEVFDYMMSLPDFPLEFANRGCQTALVVSLCNFVHFTDYNNDVCMNEDFAYELLKRGASIENVCFHNNSPLHYALKRSYIKVAKLLMEVGVDVNARNNDYETPLDLALMCDDKSEAVTALLMYGAEPSFDQFTTSVMNDDPFLVQEILFLYLCDEYSDVEIDLDVLLKLAETKSPLFHEIILFSIEVELWDYKLYLYFQALCSMSVDYLKIVIEKFGTSVSQSFAESSLSFYRYDKRKVVSITNLDVMVESEMRSEVITIISTLDSGPLFKSLIELGCSASTIEELYCFLLSYGLTCKEFDLQLIYQKFGYCKLFKILLHMDFDFFNLDFDIRGRRLLFCDPINVEFDNENIMATFIYDVSMTLEHFLSNPYIYARRESTELLRYFAHPKLREMHSEVVDEQANQAMENMPQVPLLVELSRNAFRQFFIEKFKIKTSRKFLTLLNSLPISPIHRRIITYETKLY